MHTNKRIFAILFADSYFHMQILHLTNTCLPLANNIEQIIQANVTKIIDSLNHPYSSINDNISKNKYIIDDYCWNNLRKMDFGCDTQRRSPDTFFL